MTEEPATTWTDERLDRTLGNLLRFGVILATAVVLLGGILFLVKYGDHTLDYHKPEGVRPTLRSIPGIIGETLDLRPRGVIQFGVLLLIATPFARVIFSVIAFAVQRDRTYVVVTLFVLAVLAFSIFAG